jgi:hypothetical protein
VTRIQQARRCHQIAEAELNEKGMEMKPMSRVVSLMLVGLMLLGSAPVQAGELDFGVRAGLSSDLDDLHVGGHILMHGLFNQAHAIALETAAIVGLGDDESRDYWTIRLNGNLEYEFVVSSSGIKLFPLAGLGVYFVSFDSCEPFDCDTTEAEIGLNLGGGVRYKHVALEMLLGLGDLPDFALTGSYTF